MTSFDWQFPYPSQRMPVLARNAVAKGLRGGVIEL